ncbi:hypothetical protein HOF92_14170 [bacterium]|jgi:phosphopantothenoylcysteine decarboxylase / phosphopantothenate---cysteine ligase|nr:hypothetical protein [bacterium]
MKENPKKILLIISGSIAAVKSLELVSEVRKMGHEIRCVLTPGGEKFVTPLSLEALSHQKVLRDEFEEGQLYEHLDLPKWADLILYCPASANLISRLAQGLGSDLASLVFLADNLKTPTLLFPAMNSNMFQHPLVQKNLNVLRECSVKIVGPAEGILACGEEGPGRLLEVSQILDEIAEFL